MNQKRAYLYRCYPTPSQRHMLARTFGCARFVYNWALRLSSEAYRQRGEHVFYREQDHAIVSGSGHAQRSASHEQVKKKKSGRGSSHAGHIWKLGDRIQVRAERIDPIRRRVEFSPLP